MRLVFMGSPAFAVPSLEALAASRHEIAAVVTQPDRPRGRHLLPQPPAIKIAAEKLGIPILQPATTKNPEFVEQLASFDPHALAVAAYGEILRPSVLDLPPYGAINLHASLLPKYRGAAPVAWAILQGETETGATTIQMNAGMDAGPILLQATCSIDPDDTTETLTAKIAEIGAPLFVETVDLIEAGRIVPEPQDQSLVSFAPKLQKENGLVDWGKPAEQIARQVRAFDPWPGTFTHLQGSLLKIWRASPGQSQTAEPSGTVIKISREAISVACGAGTLLDVFELQPESRPRLSAAEFANGYHILPGTRFFSTINS